MEHVVASGGIETLDLDCAMTALVLWELLMLLSVIPQVRMAYEDTTGTSTIKGATVKRDTPRFQLNRYYTHERNGKFYVTYFYKGSNCSFTAEFDNQEERAEWGKRNLKGFTAFNVEK
jgi:hypothetical protein